MCYHKIRFFNFQETKRVSHVSYQTRIFHTYTRNRAQRGLVDAKISTEISAPLQQQRRPTSGRLRHGIYHFQLVYTIGPMICTIWYIPYGIYHDIYHGIYHAKTVYTVRYTVIYTTRYIPRYIPWYMSRYIS